MKLTSTFPSKFCCRLWRSPHGAWASASVLLVALGVPFASPAIAQSETILAQALPTPLPPGQTYATSTESLPSQQYLVYVNGNSELLLEQVRQIEPGAFLNYLDGRTVIQVGRFNAYQNAQRRVEELSLLGVGAQIQEAAPSVPIASAPAGVTYANATPGDLPPLPASATPAPAVEFGTPYPGSIPAPPSYPAAPVAAPSSVLPPTASPAPIATPVVNASGYYVIIPSGNAALPGLANQVIALGAPANLVQMRQAPRGPHVAVGPFADRGIAEQWSGYFRDSGVRGTRVHHQ